MTSGSLWLDGRSMTSLCLKTRVSTNIFDGGGEGAARRGGKRGQVRKKRESLKLRWGAGIGPLASAARLTTGNCRGYPLSISSLQMLAWPSPPGHT